jgi:hypothetical protein
MRGEDNKQDAIFSYVSPEKRVSADHPLRAMREIVDTILKKMSPRFAKSHSWCEPKTVRFFNPWAVEHAKKPWIRLHKRSFLPARLQVPAPSW